MTDRDAISILDCMTADMIGTAGDAKGVGAFRDVIRQRLDALDFATSALHERMERGDGWISVDDRLPKEEEYGKEYYKRLLIAYQTDIVEYKIGYYDGYKWMDESFTRIIKGVIAWKMFEPLSEPPKEEISFVPCIPDETEI